MADATCQNDDCEKGTWELTKHPDDYSRGVTCPECGTSNVDVEMEKAGQAEARTRGPPAPAEAGGRAARPAVATEAPPAVDRGVEGGDAIFDIFNASRRGDAIQGLGAALLRVGQRTNQKEARERQRATQAEGVRRQEDHLECPECENPIERIPAEEFYCEYCGEPLEVT